MSFDELLKLPDQLLVRYFRAREIEAITGVALNGARVTVQLRDRVDEWDDLSGGLGYVPCDQARGSGSSPV